MFIYHGYQLLLCHKIVRWTPATRKNKYLHFLSGLAWLVLGHKGSSSSPSFDLQIALTVEQKKIACQ